MRARASEHRAGKYIVIAHELAVQLALATSELDRAAQAIEAGRAALQMTPSPLVGWRFEALAMRVAEQQGDLEGRARARAAARDHLATIVRDLEPIERAAFLASPAVAAVMVDD